MSVSFNNPCYTRSQSKKRKAEVTISNENSNSKNMDTNYFTQRVDAKRVRSSQSLYETNIKAQEKNIFDKYSEIQSKIPQEKITPFLTDMNILVKAFEINNYKTIFTNLKQDENSLLSDRTKKIFANLKKIFKDNQTICLKIDRFELWHKISIECKTKNWNMIEYGFYNNKEELTLSFIHSFKEKSAYLINDKNLLHEAIIKNQIYFVKLFLHYGADINKRDQYNFTPYDLALIFEHKEIQEIISQEKNFKNNGKSEFTTENEDLFDYLDKFLEMEEASSLSDEKISLLKKTPSISCETELNHKEIFAEDLISF